MADARLSAVSGAFAWSMQGCPGCRGRLHGRCKVVRGVRGACMADARLSAVSGTFAWPMQASRRVLSVRWRTDLFLLLYMYGMRGIDMNMPHACRIELSGCCIGLSKQCLFGNR